MNSFKSFVETALSFNDLGFNVFPIRFMDKTPLISSWRYLQEEAASIEQIYQWDDDYAGCNSGVVLGDSPKWRTPTDTSDAHAGGILGDSSRFQGRALYVVDVDDMDALEWAVETFGDSFFKVKTSKGMHLYYQGEPGMGKYIQLVHPHVDILGNGAYVVGPGSVHSTGSSYKYVGDDGFFSFEDLPELDVSLVKSLVGAQKSSKAHATLSEVDSCDSDVAVILADGRKVSLVDAMKALSEGEYFTCFCPFHDNKNTPAAAIYQNGLYCFSKCAKMYRPQTGIDTFAASVIQNTSEVEEVSTEKAWVPNLSETTKKVIVNNFPMGHGKTYQVAELAKGFDSVLALGPTEALTTELARKISLTAYNRVDGELVQEGLAVCLPSLTRVALNKGFRANTYDLVVADEFIQLMALLHSPLMIDQGSKTSTTSVVIETLKYFFKNAKKVVINDAYFSPAALEQLKILLGDDVESDIEWVSPPKGYKPLAGWTEVQLKSVSHALHCIAEDAKSGEKGTVHCDTKATVEEAEAILKGIGANVIAIHGESPSSVKALLENATENLSKYDWIIHNQAAGSGVSLEMDGYKSYVIGVVHPGTDGAQLRQLSGRLRAPTSKTRYSFITPGSREGLELDFNVIYASELAIEKKTGDYVIEIMGDKAVKIVRNPDVVKSRALVKWQHNLTSVNCREWYYKSLEAEGATLVKADAPEGAVEDMKALAMDVRMEINEEYLETFKDAPEMTMEQALAVDRTSSDEDKLAAKKFWHLERFGNAGMEDDVVLNADQKWEEVKLVTDMRMVAAGKKDVLVRREIKKSTPDWRKENEVHSAMFSNEVIRAEVLYKVLSLVGYSDEMLTTLEGMDKVKVCHHLLSTNVLENIQEIDKKYGFKVLFETTSPDSMQKIPGFVSRLLKKMGFETKRVKTTVNGERLNARTVAMESVGEMCALSQRRLDKLTGKEVSAVNPTAEPLVEAPKAVMRESQKPATAPAPQLASPQLSMELVGQVRTPMPTTLRELFI